tara:strand:- start:359 stop:880 length:522 start_codon:yes stop_codon:yes gene_type:complete
VPVDSGASAHINMAGPAHEVLANEIRTQWAVAGLQVEGVSHEGSGVKVKCTLPHELDLTDFCAWAFDQGATVHFLHDAVAGPVVVVESHPGLVNDTPPTKDVSSDDESVDNKQAKLSATPTGDAEKLPDKVSFKPSACAALSLARNVLELFGVVLVSAYFFSEYETNANFTAP